VKCSLLKKLLGRRYLLQMFNCFRGLRNDGTTEDMFFLLLTTFSSVYAGSYWDEVSDVDDCKVLAEQGDANAQKSLGVMYHKGKGVLLSLL